MSTSVSSSSFASSSSSSISSSSSSSSVSSFSSSSSRLVSCSSAWLSRLWSCLLDTDASKQLPLDLLRLSWQHVPPPPTLFHVGCEKLNRVSSLELTIWDPRWTLGWLDRAAVPWAESPLGERRAIQVLSLDDHTIVAGGGVWCSANSFSIPVTTNELHRFCPQTNTWSPAPNLPLLLSDWSSMGRSIACWKSHHHEPVMKVRIWHSSPEENDNLPGCASTDACTMSPTTLAPSSSSSSLATSVGGITSTSQRPEEWVAGPVLPDGIQKIHVFRGRVFAIVRRMPARKAIPTTVVIELDPTTFAIKSESPPSPPLRSDVVLSSALLVQPGQIVLSGISESWTAKHTASEQHRRLCCYDIVSGRWSYCSWRVARRMGLASLWNPTITAVHDDPVEHKRSTTRTTIPSGSISDERSHCPLGLHVVGDGDYEFLIVSDFTHKSPAAHLYDAASNRWTDLPLPTSVLFGCFSGS